MGTDTMAYTASALSFMLENLGKTVIFTGARVGLRRYGDGTCGTAQLRVIQRVTGCRTECAGALRGRLFRREAKPPRLDGRGPHPRYSRGALPAPRRRNTALLCRSTHPSAAPCQVCIFFDDALFRGNRARKADSGAFHAYACFPTFLYACFPTLDRRECFRSRTRAAPVPWVSAACCETLQGSRLRVRCTRRLRRLRRLN
jgi:hypothetical protein